MDLVGWILVLGGAGALLLAGAAGVALLVKAVRGSAARLTDPGVGPLLVLILVGLVGGVVMIVLGGNVWLDAFRAGLTYGR
jgi:hypothetical protein